MYVIVHKHVTQLYNVVIGLVLDGHIDLPWVSCYMQKYVPFIMYYGRALMLFTCKLHWLQTFEHMSTLLAINA